ncbi:alpha/beta fold hydrolase [Comamonadaceae bacterium G21597-S1]|nr:alpha/beta fold hydrolase [Comamonadaceae bacterium G21597-S1]
MEPFTCDLSALAGTRHTAIIEGRRVVWRRFGAGPALVLLHGGHGDWRHWIRNIAPLARDHSIWLPDLPGFGDSDDLLGHAHAPERMERMVDALVVAIERLIAPAAALDLAGFSFGGLVAAHLAARVPVRRLVLLGPAGHGGARRQSVPLTDWRALRGDRRKMALQQNLAAFMLHDRTSVDDRATAIYESQCERTRFRSKAISQAGGLAQCLNHLTMPVLIAWGEHDVTAQPQEIGPQLADGVATRQWRLIRDAGHWVQYERHDAVDALLVDWFDVGAAPAPQPARR